MPGQADDVEIWVGGHPVAAGNPVPTAPQAGGSGGLTDTELRATPVKVDDDATQAALASILAALADGTLRGTVTITDGSGPVTVDGTVTANLQPTTSGGSDVYETIDQQNGGNSVKGSAGQVYGWF